MNKGLITWVAIIMLGLTGCGKQVAAPVEINEEADKCQTCNMQVINDPSSTELILKNGQAMKFDDIGCMIDWKKQHASEEIDVMYVRDYYTQQWVKQEEATYAYDPSFQTPMAYGIFSFKENKDAQKFVEEQKKGVVFPASELDKHLQPVNQSGTSHQ